MNMYKYIFFNNFYPLLLKCISISFDKDQLSIILIVTITPSVINLFSPGNKIVFIISLHTSKSNGNNIPLAKPNRIVSLCIVCSLIDFLKILKTENKDVKMEIIIIIPAARSIPDVRTSMYGLSIYRLQ